MSPSFLLRSVGGAACRSSLKAKFSSAVLLCERRFLATAPQGNTAPASVATEAFPFLARHSPAEASRLGSIGSLVAESLRGSANVSVIRDMAAFEAEVYRRPPQPLAIFFTAKCNTHNKQLLEMYASIASSVGSSVKFLVVDVDEVPRAAYHCGVEDSCTFVVQYHGDAFRKRVSDPLGTKTPQQLTGDFRAALDECLKTLQESEPPQQQVEWYSHSIPVDNLNVYRVNWPTA